MEKLEIGLREDISVDGELVEAGQVTSITGAGLAHMGNIPPVGSLTFMAAYNGVNDRTPAEVHTSNGEAWTKVDGNNALEKARKHHKIVSDSVLAQRAAADAKAEAEAEAYRQAGLVAQGVAAAKLAEGAPQAKSRGKKADKAAPAEAS